MEKSRVLVVDDEANARNALAELLRDEGHNVETAADAFKALGKVDDFEPDIVLTDLRMPGMDGLELLRKLRAGDENRAVVVMTAFGAIESAVVAMKEGAADYLAKPINVTELTLVLKRELDRMRLRREAGLLRQRLSERYSFQNIIGSAPPMQEIFKTVVQVATARASVLITGESGTGKELIAAAIHERGRAARGALRPGSRRHAVPRRDRRHLAGGAGEAAALPAGARVRAGGRQRDGQGRRASHRRHQP